LGVEPFSLAINDELIIEDKYERPEADALSTEMAASGIGSPTGTGLLKMQDLRSST